MNAKRTAWVTKFLCLGRCACPPPFLLSGIGTDHVCCIRHYNDLGSTECRYDYALQSPSQHDPGAHPHRERDTSRCYRWRSCCRCDACHRCEYCLDLVGTVDRPCSREAAERSGELSYAVLDDGSSIDNDRQHGTTPFAIQVESAGLDRRNALDNNFMDGLWISK